MKAILIDPAKREVSGIEVEKSTIRCAFVSTTRIGVDLDVIPMNDGNATMFFDKNGVLKFPSEYFYYGEKLRPPIFGRGLLIGKPGSIELTVREVQQLTAFGS